MRKDIASVDLVHLYQEGLSLKNVGLRFGFSVVGVKNRLLKEGVKLRTPWRKGTPHLSKRKPNAERNHVWDTYQRCAGCRGLCWNLTLEKFLELINSPCHYCGTEKSNCRKSRKINSPAFYYNGIDRKDNSVGYTPENCVPCCNICNAAKTTMSYAAFTDWLNKIVKFRKE